MTKLVAVLLYVILFLISPYFYQKADGLGVRISAGSTLKRSSGKAAKLQDGLREGRFELQGAIGFMLWSVVVASGGEPC